MSLTKGLGHRDSFYRFLVVSIAFSNLYYTRILSSGFLDPQVVVSCFEQICSLSRVHRDLKKIYRVEFFDKTFSSGPTNYVIRHISK